MEPLKKFLTSRVVLIIAAFLLSFALNGFTDAGKSAACAFQPEQCIADAVKRVTETPSKQVLEAVQEKAPEVDLMQVKTIDGDITIVVPPSDSATK